MIPLQSAEVGRVSTVEPLFAAALINSARYLLAQKERVTSERKWSSAGEGEGRGMEDVGGGGTTGGRKKPSSCNSVKGNSQ